MRFDFQVTRYLNPQEGKPSKAAARQTPHTMTSVSFISAWKMGLSKFSNGNCFLADWVTPMIAADEKFAFSTRFLPTSVTSGPPSLCPNRCIDTASLRYGGLSRNAEISQTARACFWRAPKKPWMQRWEFNHCEVLSLRLVRLLALLTWSLWLGSSLFKPGGL